MLKIGREVLIVYSYRSLLSSIDNQTGKLKWFPNCEVYGMNEVYCQVCRCMSNLQLVCCWINRRTDFTFFLDMRL